MKNWIYALILGVQRKWKGKTRYIEAKVSFFECMTTSEQELEAELSKNGFDLGRPIERTQPPDQAAYIYRQEIK